MTTGERIKAARKAAKMTQADLAKKLGIPFQSISQWERDLRNPKSETIQRIAKALGCTPWELVPPPHQSSPESRRQVEELMGKEPGYLDAPIPTEQEETEKLVQRVRDLFTKMNQDGQEEAVRRVKELSRLPEYQKKESPSLSSLWGFDRRGKDAVDSKENE